MKAYLVARVSTEDQIEAIQSQVYRLLDYAKERFPDYELIKIQESAYKGDRAGLNEIITTIKERGEPAAIVFDKVDRYSRDSTSNEIRQLKQMSDKGYVELHFPSDNLVIDRTSPATDIMRLGLNVVLAQYYSDSTRDNVKRTQQARLREGRIIGWAPYGYKNVTLPNGVKSVQLDGIKAEVVRYAYELYVTGGYSLKTLSQRIKLEYGETVGKDKIDRFLKNPFYKGEILYNGVRYPHIYEKIVTEEIFTKAAEVRESKNVKPQKYAGLPYAYRSLIRCSECGCMITFEKKKKTYVYGHCTQYRGKHGAPYILEDEFTKQLSVMVEALSMPEDKYESTSKELREIYEEKKKIQNSHRTNLYSEIARIESRITKNYDTYLEGIIDKETYAEKHKSLTETKAALQKRMSTFELDEDKRYGTYAHLLDLSKNIKMLFKKADFEQKRKLLNMVLSNLELSGKQLRWEFKKPYAMMAFCSENSTWLPGRDSNSRPID